MSDGCCYGYIASCTPNYPSPSYIVMLSDATYPDAKWNCHEDELELVTEPTPNSNKPKPKPVITLDPYQFVRFFDICPAYREVFNTNKWVDAWTAGMRKHKGLGEMCDWLQQKGGSCVCGKGYAEWKKEAERVLRVKLVDYKGIVDRISRKVEDIKRVGRR